MAWFFGDSFDTYQQVSDALLGGTYWDSGNAATFELSPTGRSTGSKSFTAATASTSTAGLVKSSGSNDTTHHLNFAYYQSLTLSGTTKMAWFTLSDGTTAQVTVAVRSDGAILLYSGNAASTTVLATYTGAVAAINTWYSFECEIVVNNTTGSFKVRKNGNTSDDSSTTSLNTRASANNYANKLSFGTNTNSGNCLIDDLFWRSDTTVAWAGDLRCNTRLPASDAAVTWTRSGSVVPVTPFAQGGTGTITTNAARYSPFIAVCDGTVASVVVSLNVGFTGNLKGTIFNDSSGTPGTVLGSATPIVNPIAGSNTLTFSAPAVTRGTKYWVGFDSDTTTAAGWNLSVNNFTGAYTNQGKQSSTAYASFPTATPTISSSDIQCIVFTVNITPTTAANANLVADLTQDGAGGYVLDSTPGDTDLYNLQSISGTPTSILAVVTRMLAQKSDAGTRTAALVLKSGATTSAGSTVALNTSFGHIFRTDTVDPNTGTAWTATAVNNLQVGPKVVA